MKKDAVIRIVSMQRTENGDNAGEMSVVGTITYGDEKNIIEYVENNEETGPEETTITVFNNDTVSIVRRGQFSSEMMVEKNARHHTFYVTPYGELTMGIYMPEIECANRDEMRTPQSQRLVKMVRNAYENVSNHSRHSSRTLSDRYRDLLSLLPPSEEKVDRRGRGQPARRQGRSS